MIFSRLENIRKEKRDNQKVVSLLFDSSNRQKTFLSSSSVSDMLMAKTLVHSRSCYYNVRSSHCNVRSSHCNVRSRYCHEILNNHLNLPTYISLSTKGTINYLYPATGVKVKKTVTDGSTITVTDYLDGFQYKTNALEFFPHAEGYVKATAMGLGGNISGYAYNYVYNHTDHLGNVRISYAKDPQTGNLKILDENHYYPFGLRHSTYAQSGFVLGYQDVIIAPITNSPYKYKYNGFELQDEFGLGWYDYFARNYDPAIGRWFNIDPLAEKSRRNSPYVYALNNPVFFIDPDGMEAEANNSSSDSGSGNDSGGSSNFNPSGVRAMGIPIETVMSTSMGGGFSQSNGDNSKNKSSNTQNSEINKFEDGIINNDRINPSWETKFVDECGNIIIDIDDGSDAVFIVRDDKLDKFVEEVKKGIFLNIDYNKKLGEKYGTSLQNPFGEYKTNVDYQAGYVCGYAETKNSILACGTQVSGDFKDRAYFNAGEKAGKRDYVEGKMNKANFRVSNDPVQCNVLNKK